MSSGEEEVDYPDTPPENYSPAINLRTRKCPRRPIQTSTQRIEEDGDTGFSHHSSLNKQAENTLKPGEIITTNKYQILSDNDADTEADDQLGHKVQGQSNQPNQPPESRAPTPPIVINVKPMGKTLIEKIKSLATKGFYLKYTKEATQLHAIDPEERLQILQWLKTANTPHHTYTTSRDKTHEYVLEGLDEQNIETEEIKNELLELKVPVIQVYKMNRTNKPKNLVVTKSEVTLKLLQQCVKSD